MAGPTPVSALIHAATMVAAGVYLVGRLFIVFVEAEPFVLQIVGVIGAITMLGAALMAFVQDDIKRVLAYSTISQLAYMVAGMSMGPAGRTAGFFHLFTHAFFKALLFLGSGAVIHAVHSNNMSEMGGLRNKLPITFWTFLIGSLALAGVPPLAGFWSKDELLVVADHEGHPVLFVVLLVTAVLTAFYMARAVLMTFFGDYRGHGEPHEAPRSMTGVLVALATATVFVGLLGFAAARRSVRPVGLLRGARGGAVRAVDRRAVDSRGDRRDLGRVRPVPPLSRAGPAARARARLHPGLEQVLPRRPVLEGIVRPVRDDASRGVYWSNQKILDGIVNGAAAVTKVVANAVRWFDTHVLDGLVNAAGNFAGFTGGLLRYIQSGNVQRYAAFLFSGIVVLAIIITRI